LRLKMVENAVLDAVLLSHLVKLKIKLRNEYETRKKDFIDGYGRCNDRCFFYSKRRQIG